jgi:hypothetical protein
VERRPLQPPAGRVDVDPDELADPVLVLELLGDA